RTLRAVVSSLTGNHSCRSVASDGREEGVAPEQSALPLSHKPVVTERERAVIGLIAQGLCNKEIAQRLNISTQTVKNHVSRLLEKLDCADRTQLAVYALEHHVTYGQAAAASADNATLSQE